MKIVKRIKTGALKGYTIRKSKQGWYDLYSPSGLSQTFGKWSLDQIKQIAKDKRKNINETQS